MGEASTISKRILKPLYVDIKIDEYIQSIIDDVDSPLLKSKIAFYGKKKTYLLNGIVTVLAYKIVGGEDPERIVHGSRGTSLFSLSGSAFDDLFDEYIMTGLKDGGTDNSATLCSSMIILTHGITEISRACEGLPLEMRNKIFGIIEKCLSSATEGFQFQNRNRREVDIHENEYIEYVCKKASGSWGRIGATIGAVLGGGDDETVNALGNFGMNYAAAIQAFDHSHEVYEDTKYGFYYPPVLQALKWNPTTIEALKNPPIDDVVLDMIFDDTVQKRVKENYSRIINRLLDDATRDLTVIPYSESKDLLLGMVYILRKL